MRKIHIALRGIAEDIAKELIHDPVMKELCHIAHNEEEDTDAIVVPLADLTRQGVPTLWLTGSVRALVSKDELSAQQMLERTFLLSLVRTTPYRSDMSAEEMSLYDAVLCTSDEEKEAVFSLFPTQAVVAVALNDESVCVAPVRGTDWYIPEEETPGIFSRRKMQLSAKETGMSYAVLNGLQKIRLSGSEKRIFARWGRLYAKSAKLVNILANQKNRHTLFLLFIEHVDDIICGTDVKPAERISYDKEFRVHFKFTPQQDLLNISARKLPDRIVNRRRCNSIAVNDISCQLAALFSVKKEMRFFGIRTHHYVFGDVQTSGQAHSKPVFGNEIHTDTKFFDFNW